KCHGIDWLRQMRVEAGLERSLLVVLLAPPGQCHDDDVLAAWLTADLPARLVPVDARHVEVEEDEIGLELCDRIEAGDGVVRRAGHASKLLDDHRDRLR